MSDVATLKYPNKSHRKEIILPKYSKNLAEFFGIMLGDGGINNPWQANITINATADRIYAKYISILCKKIFGMEPAIRERKKINTLVLSLSSVTVVDFLVLHGLPRGNKLKNGLNIPKWILDKPLYSKWCVRGLVDTDGCVFVHTHRIRNKTYKNIGITFRSYSPQLIFQVAEVLEEFGIIPHISKRGQDIFLYQASSVEKYLKVFGTSNSRIKSVYLKWKGA